MKHSILTLAVFMLTTLGALAQKPAKDFELPQLHTIGTVTLSPSYSCRSADDFQQGYVNTALFLSAYAQRRNSPDLLFNGACQAQDYFEASTAGDDFSLIADLGGNVSLHDVSASRAFNLKRVHSFADYSKFAATVSVVANHTYVVVLNNSEKRGLFVFTVDEYVPNQRVVLRYAVKSYEISPTQHHVRSEGFDWMRTNN